MGDEKDDALERRQLDQRTNAWSLAGEVYADALKPAVQEIGGLLGDAVRGTRALLSSLPDRFARLLKRAQDRVPEGDQVAPPPQLVGAVLDGLKYEPEEMPIAEMFEQLLASAINKETASGAHPAYAQIIKQLSPDEALILYWVANEQRLLRKFSLGPDQEAVHFIECWEVPYDRLSIRDAINVADLAGMYYDRMRALGLVHLTQRDNDGNISTDQISLTEFGRLFAETCIPKQGFTYLSL